MLPYSTYRVSSYPFRDHLTQRFQPFAGLRRPDEMPMGGGRQMRPERARRVHGRPWALGAWVKDNFYEKNLRLDSPR
jgi:hypothetical protein